MVKNLKQNQAQGRRERERGERGAEWNSTKLLVLTHYQAESVSKRSLCPREAIVRQVDVLCCAVDVTPTHPSS